MSTELTLIDGSPRKSQIGLPSTPKPYSSYTLPKRPWRLYVTPFEQILAQDYPGSGTEEDPYIVDWIPNDVEDPQKWSGLYSWFNIVICSIATLAITLSSSAYTGGIDDMIRHFGSSVELLTSGESIIMV